MHVLSTFLLLEKLGVVPHEIFIDIGMWEYLLQIETHASHRNIAGFLVSEADECTLRVCRFE